ncbi:hypothetical protein OAO01_04690 [Oligoflexia bacterium]|nr:hypothetical protein [Oligoflexia bacterium]
MPKGQVTEDDLSSALDSVGGLGTLGKPKTRRDSPFGQDQVTVKEESPKTEKTVEFKVKSALKEPIKKEISPPKAQTPKERKQDIYTERVNLFISPDMRDKIDTLAKQIQRQKTDKTERITSNTVMRAALNHLIKHFDLHATDIANSEKELAELVERKLR